MVSKPNYHGLIEFCESNRQREIIQALIDTGSQPKAAEKIGLNERNVRRAVQRVKAAAASRGYAPEHDMIHVTPEGFDLRGTSTLYDEDGVPKLQWVKTGKAAERQEALYEALLDKFEDVKPLKKVKIPRKSNKELLTVYPMGDPHLGMYACAEEAGVDFDCDIASRELFAATDRLVEISPNSDTGILLNLGDFFHADNTESRTRRSGNVLDVDTRWHRVLDIGLETMIRLVRRMLEKHKKVIVRNNIGNHDEHTSIMLSVAMRAFFKDNKRVEVSKSPNPFWYYRHGHILIGSTHGDQAKMPALPAIMAQDRAEDWGQTKFRYWYTGHIHTQKVFEYPGCVVESFRTLAPNDAWSNAMGFRSGKDMHCIVHSLTSPNLERYSRDVDSL